MSWNSNNRAHACLWLFEVWYCRQEDTPFSEAGSWKTEFLIRLGGGASGDFATNSAQAHASMVDQAMSKIFRAKYEASKTTSTSISAMTAVLADSSKTMADLGEIVDEQFRFGNEL